MPDITKCLGKGCKQRDNCYRFTSTPDRWQSYFSKPFKVKRKCDEFMEISCKPKWSESQVNSFIKMVREVNGPDVAIPEKPRKRGKSEMREDL